MSISNKPELNIDLRHDFIQILAETVTDDQVKALIEDMEAIGFNCAFRREEESKEVQFLVGLNDHDRIL